ncbi:MAG: OsmC family protein [bacterium]
MVTIDLTYEGDLRVKAVHGPSKTQIMTDAPVDNQGKGESFSPTDLVATALGACMATIMGIVAKRHDIDLRGMTVAVKKHMVNEPIRRIGTIEVHFKVPTPKEEKYKSLLQKAALTCPVHQSLHPDVKQEITFDWI